MRSTKTLCTSMVAAVVALASGCGSDDVEPGDGASPPDAGSADAPAPSDGGEDAGACEAGELRFDMTMHQDPWITEPVLPDVRACVLDRSDLGCAVSDATGTWSLCLPASAELALTLEREGYLATIFPMTTPAQLPLPAHQRSGVLFDEASAGDFWLSAGVAYPPTEQALVWVRTHTEGPGEYLPPNLGEVSAAFTPVAAHGPLYQAVDGAYDPTATATNDAQPDLFAAGLAEDGSQEVTLEHPTLSTCGHLDGGWAGASPGSIRIPARAGFRTVLLAACRR